LGNQKRRSAGGKLIAGCAIALLAAAIAAPGAQARTITIAPSSTSLANCYPFGSGIQWPYLAWFYQFIPAFDLHPGDVIAFDTGQVNDFDVQLDIAMARTRVNGGTNPAQPFQKVVRNTQTPANPRGDTTAGNYELRFRAQAPFHFPGGGLIIRFSNPSLAYQQDNSTCTQVLEGGSAGDLSGFFVGRSWGDHDGRPPWANRDDGPEGQFRLILDTTPPNTTITAGPSGKTHSHRAKFHFESSEPHSTFKCSLDHKRFRHCRSPKKYKHLDSGKHTFRVRAFDRAGNADPTPAKRRWKVV
jgi:hypothetical protein